MYSVNPKPASRIGSQHSAHARLLPDRADVVIAIMCVAIGLANTFWSRHNGLLTGLPIGAAAVGGLVGALVALRRTFPCAVAIVVSLAHLLTFTPTAFAVMMYTLGNLYRRHRAVLAAVMAAGTSIHITTIMVNVSEPEARSIFYTLAFVVGPVALGAAAGLRRDLTESLRNEAEHLQKEQQLTAEHACSAERARIAREMHDVVSHRVSHIVLSAGALEVTAQQNPELVVEQARRIRTYGQQALSDLRDILGLLHAARRSDTAPRAPQPTLHDLPALIESARKSGQVPILLNLPDEEELDALPDAQQRAVYRVVQESLTNALKHAPGAPIAISIVLTRYNITIDVINEAPQRIAYTEVPGSGKGLLGLTERVRLLGGVFAADHLTDGGFRTHTVIPTAIASSSQCRG
ncbi:sensor histidine kinase [Streptomyces spectabilis]|uniref:histidine kinase n=1 Tax=Streptomyces spectabilis TaxID=68270 RepID=A0A7W8B6W9_STRST|nr:histidine kinase [Streptomyces spectabilis]MBB5109688.1 signal transduction histidine kinase [Streptomyces spectabilis]